MAGEWTYLATPLLATGAMEEIPLTGVEFNSGLMNLGELKGQINLNSSPVLRSQLEMTQPAKSALWVDLDGSLVWGGVIWGRPYDAKEGKFEFVVKEFLSYYERRVITQTIQQVQVDQFDIVRAIFQQMDDGTINPNGSIALQIGPGSTPRLRDRTYWGYELKQTLEALDQLARVIDGFDYHVDVFYQAGFPTKQLNLSYPSRGISPTDSNLHFDYPGLVDNITFPEDGSGFTTQSWAIGSGEGDTMLRSVADDATLLGGGYPLLQSVYSYKDIVIQGTLDDHAQADLEANAGAKGNFVVTVPILGPQGLGTFAVGDWAKINNQDPILYPPNQYPFGNETYQRIIDIAVHPDEGTMALTLSSQAER